MHILVIDDEISYLELLKEILDRKGYQVSTSPNALLALKQINSLRLDLIIVDFQIPGLNGLEFIDAIRKLKIETPAVLISGHEINLTREQRKKSNIIGYLTKPIDFDEMEKLLHQVC